MTESQKCPECNEGFSVNFADPKAPVLLPCKHTACQACTKWDVGGGAGAGKGHYKGKERGNAYCPVCKEMKFHEEEMCVNWHNGEGASDDSDADEIRFNYEMIAEMKKELAK